MWSFVGFDKVVHDIEKPWELLNFVDDHVAYRLGERKNLALELHWISCKACFNIEIEKIEPQG
jgi:hypothetical protein